MVQCKKKKIAACLELATRRDPTSAGEQRDKSLHAPRCRLSQEVACRGLNLPAVWSSGAAWPVHWQLAEAQQVLRGGEEHSDAKSCVNIVTLPPPTPTLPSFTYSSSSMTHHPPLPNSTSTFLPESNLLITGGDTEERGRRGLGEGKQAFPHVADPLPHSIHLPAEAFILFS